ncbi:guanine nucleotide-binding protein G(s) subunit alpha isoforms XLas-like isoform X2 [Cygnus olor]|uniref:guanine nucleotide-binding protein G(s) subunit alpha isoforms XLas-like isoform X2 n=1 Tax=Cygnus olor TaxID=8869 RepID=UPI001ADE388B|nr:guanine nucleotide-binding protein G(s) subunit alpha isoforms XLas-like isoform X2 [Cygnus olor]
MQPLCQQGAAMRSQRRAVTLCQATGTSLRRPQRRHSRGGGSMGRMWGAAAPTRLLLLLLVLAGLCARDAWAMPRRALAAGDDARGSAYPAPQPDPGVELQGHPSGRAVPAAPWNPAPETGWHPTGDGSVTSEHGPVLVPQGDPTSPRRATYQAKRGKSSQRTSGILKEILKELEGAQGADGEAVQQEAFPRGNTLPGSEGAREAAQATVPPVLSEPGEAHHTRVFQFFQEKPGAAGEGTASASDGAAVRKHCLVSAAAIVGSLLFGTLLCCGLIRLRRRRQQRLSAASEARAPRRARRRRPPPGRAQRTRPPPATWLQHDQPSALQPPQPPWAPPPRPPPPSRPSYEGWGQPPRRAGQRGGEDWQPSSSFAERHAFSE